MIFITGDTHIPVDIKKLSSKRFSEQKNMSKKDYVIICGDFGGVWDNSNEYLYWLEWLENKSFTTLFVDGNHENFDILNSYPIIDFNGGKVHKISDSIFHLMRGQIYNLDGKTVFTLGGASSHDKECRVEGKSYWRDELPSMDELKFASENLKLADNKVDYIISHSAPDSIQHKIAPSYEENELTNYLEKVKGNVNYKKWFFGHYHIDELVDNKHIAVFNLIHQINE